MTVRRSVLLGAVFAAGLGVAVFLSLRPTPTPPRPTALVRTVPSQPTMDPPSSATVEPNQATALPAHELLAHVRSLMAEVRSLPDDERRDALRRLHRIAMDLPPVEGVGELCGQLATQFILSGTDGFFRESVELYDRAATLSTDPISRALALASFGSITNGIFESMPDSIALSKRSFMELDRMFRSGELAGKMMTEDLWADALFYLAYHAEVDGDHAASVRHHQEALSKMSPPRDEPTTSNRIRCEVELAGRLARAGRGEEAVEWMNALLRKYPEHGIAPDPHARLPAGTRAWWLAGRNQYLGLKPDDPRYSTHLEDIAIDPRLNSLPESLPLLNTLGFSYLRQSRWSEAAGVFARNLQVFAPMAERGELNAEGLEYVRHAMWQLGKAFEGMGEHQRAAEAYRALLDRYPASEEARWARDALESLSFRVRGR